jgi:hypothetical protein
MRVMMIISSAVSYFINGAIAKAKYGDKPRSSTSKRR